MATIIGKDLYGNVTYKIDDNDTQTMLPNLAENGDTIPAYGGQPKIVTTAAEMTDTDVIYLYMGDEEGYTSGDWYYYDAADEEWKSGGAYVANPVTIDDTLTQAGEAADAKATGDAIDGVSADLTAEVETINTALDTKADTTGVYPYLTAGNAQQLEPETKVTDRTPYIFRPTPGDYRREEVEVVGGSVIENQLINSAQYRTAFTAQPDVTITVNGNVWSASGTWTTGGQFRIHDDPMTIVQDHVYLLWFNPAHFVNGSGKNLSIRSSTAETGIAASANGAPCIAKARNSMVDAYLMVTAVTTAGANEYTITLEPMLIDLTAKLGPTIADYINTLETANAGAGVAWYQKYFGTDYNPYSAPTIKNVEGVSAHRMTGKNIFGGSAMLDSFKAANISGFTYTDTTMTFSASNMSGKKMYLTPNGTPLKENTQYTFIITSSNSSASVATNLLVVYTNGTTERIEQANATANLKQTKVFVSAAGKTVAYIGGSYSAGTTTLYYNESGIFEGVLTASDFEPYTVHTYAMDGSLTLRGIPKIADGEMYYDGDTYSADGTVTRKYRLVDLGSLDWSFSNTAFYASVSGIKHGVSEVNIVTDRYRLVNATSGTGSASDWADKVVRGNSGTYSHLYIKDTSYQTAEAFKAAMDGVYAVIELQTPTTESATPYTTPQICAPGGTEEWVTTGVVPVGQDTLYWPDLTSKVEGLPGDFSTLIAPTEENTTASRSYAENRLFILDNVLYKVVSAIASGETITPGTNATAATLDDVIAELRALIAAIE